MVYRLCVVLLLAGMFSVATAESQKGKASGAISISNAPVQESSSISSSSSAAYTLLYQGVISNSDGSSVTDGLHSLTFRVYDGPDGGVDLWTEVVQVTTQNGYFSAILGLTNPLNLPKDKDLYMGIQVEGDISEMTPRQQVAASNSGDSNSPGNPPTILDVNDVDWLEEDFGTVPNVLYTRGEWGLNRGSVHSAHANQLFGDTRNHVNLGREGVTGTNGANYSDCTIGGGYGNQASSDATTVAGGFKNAASGKYSAIIGGDNNVASGNNSVIGGGDGNEASADGSTVGGGGANTASGSNSAVMGGMFNKASGLSSSIIGGEKNLASGGFSTAAGGRSDTVKAVYGGAAAGYTNKVGDATTDTGAFVGGGVNNTVSNKYGSVGGGKGNLVSSDYSSIGGGNNNQTFGNYSSIGGGYLNAAAGAYSAIAGGKENVATGQYSFVAGQNNTANGLANAVGGGNANISRGDYSTIPGGYGNDAAGDYSFAAGKSASALYDGCFVWKDASEGYFSASAPNQFLIKAEGGVGIGTNAPATKLDVIGDLRVSDGIIKSSGNFILVDDSYSYAEVYGGALSLNTSATVAPPAGGIYAEGDILTSGNVGIGATSPQTKLEVAGSIRSTYPDNPSLYTDIYYHISQGPTIEGHGFSKLSLAPDGATAMTLQSDGKVGIGTTSPGQKLDVNGSLHLSDGSLFSSNNFGFLTDVGAAQTLKAGAIAITNNYTNNPPANGLYVQGNVGIGTTSPNSKLSVSGNADLTGNLTVGGSGTASNITVKKQNTPGTNLVVIGPDASNNGRIDLYNASGNPIVSIGEGLDYAESFPTSYEKLDPGTVMSIDPSNAGKLKICESAFDKKVAGIVAGANGLNSGVKLGMAGIEGDQPLALAGRVFCKVDGSFGAVEPGDLLTTSSTPGYAMVVKDYENARGAIIGKAMQSVVEGEKTLILVLVSLQ
jgi:hypothetical protein